MLEFLRDRGVSERKRRLFACACCRGIWRLLTDERCRAAVETAERYADGLATEDDWAAAGRAAEAVVVGASDAALMDAADAASSAAGDVGWAAQAAAWAAVYDTAGASTWSIGERTAAFKKQSERQVFFLRDIFGNPFRSLVFDPSWRTFSVRAMARQMYESRDFSAMPVFADALEEAGCQDEQLLEHCRGPGPHVRGCHVVDLALGKT
jgi:hypothetical protein